MKNVDYGKGAGLNGMGSVLFCLVTAITTATFSYVALMSVCFTDLFHPDPYAEVISSMTWLSSPCLMLAGLLWLVLIGGLLYLICRLAKRLNERSVLLGVVLVTSAFGCLVVLSAHSTGHIFPDAHSLIEYASRASSGDWESFLPEAEHSGFAPDVPSAYTYFRFYPYQIGGFLYFLAVFKLFGAGNVVALELCNVVANEVALLSLTLLVWEATESKAERVCAPVLMGLNAPFFILAAVPYGNSVGFSLTCLYLLLQVKSFRAEDGKGTLLYQLASIAPLGVGLAIKSTYQVIALGMVAAWFVLAARRGKWLGFGLSALVLVLALALAGLPKTYFEHATGIDYGEGLPTVSWLEIGLTGSTGINDQPGWWDSDALDAWNEAQQDTEATKELLGERLSGVLGEYAENPGTLSSFLSRKLERKWAEPTYQSIMYLKYNRDAEGEPVDVGLLGSGPSLTFLDGLQSAIYIGAALEAIRILRERRSEGGDVPFMLCCAVMAGFACYLLWEAKSVYILPFVTLMTPLAAAGYAWAFSNTGAFLSKAGARSRER